MKLTIQYYAHLREQRGENEEELDIDTTSLKDLYAQLKEKYQFTLNENQLRVSVNNKFVPWEQNISEGDRIIFIPPVSGG